MQMDAPDTDEIKTGTDVVSTEDALSQPGYSQSPIHGGEDHDEISKLLVQRLRKLAGLQEEPDTATGQYSYEQVQAADVDPKGLPPMPNIVGLQPGQTKDLGDGQRVEIGRDGNIHYSGGFGKVVYSPQGKPLSYNSPRVGGVGMTQDFNTGDTTTSYNAGPIDMSMTKNAQGQPVQAGGTYRVNKNASISVDTPFNNGQKGITKMVGQAADPDDIAHLMGTDASAQRMRVDPKAFAKFQQGMPKEDAQLEAMLRIARLR